MIIPTTLADLTGMVQDGVQESIHLDYKSSPALGTDSRSRNELAKDVSAFANSDGGVLIYGIEERQQRPNRLDGGVDTRAITREWIETIVRSTISPPIDDVRIYPIEAPPVRFIIRFTQPKVIAARTRPSSTNDITNAITFNLSRWRTTRSWMCAHAAAIILRS